MHISVKCVVINMHGKPSYTQSYKPQDNLPCPVWKVCIAQGRNPQCTFDACCNYYIFEISPAQFPNFPVRCLAKTGELQFPKHTMFCVNCSLLVRLSSRNDKLVCSCTKTKVYTIYQYRSSIQTECSNCGKFSQFDSR